MERGTMLLLLTYPLSRWQVVLGKFLGHVAILGVATLIGYGAAAVALAVTGEAIAAESWHAFAAMIGSTVLLGAAFVALGTFVSAVVRARGTAAGIAVGLWLFSVLIWDMALLGLLVADQGQTIDAAALDALLLLNPADAYRLFNLAGLPNVGQLSGMGGIAGGTGLTAPALLGALGIWILVPLTAAVAIFARREL